MQSVDYIKKFNYEEIETYIGQIEDLTERQSSSGFY